MGITEDKYTLAKIARDIEGLRHLTIGLAADVAKLQKADESKSRVIDEQLRLEQERNATIGGILETVQTLGARMDEAAKRIGRLEKPKT